MAKGCVIQNDAIHATFDQQCRPEKKSSLFRGAARPAVHLRHELLGELLRARRRPGPVRVQLILPGLPRLGRPLAARGLKVGIGFKLYRVESI